MANVGDRLRITTGNHQDRWGTVTKVNGPKTVEMKMDAGFMIWNAKVANTAPELPEHDPGCGCWECITF